MFGLLAINGIGARFIAKSSPTHLRFGKYVYFCTHKPRSAQAEQKTKANMEKKKLYRSMTDKKLCGVCGGIAEYFDIDPTLVRLLWVCASLFSACFPGLLTYIVCALVLPQQNQMPNP